MGILENINSKLKKISGNQADIENKSVLILKNLLKGVLISIWAYVTFSVARTNLVVGMITSVIFGLALMSVYSPKFKKSLMGIMGRLGSEMDYMTSELEKSVPVQETQKKSNPDTKIEKTDELIFSDPKEIFGEHPTLILEDEKNVEQKKIE